VWTTSDNYPYNTTSKPFSILYFLSQVFYSVFSTIFIDILNKCRRTGSSETFIFYSWSVFHNLFLYLHLSAHPIFYTLNPFKLYTNTSNYLNMLLNSLFHTSLLFFNTLWSSSIIHISTYPLSYALEVSAKHSGSLLFQFLYSKLFLIT